MKSTISFPGLGIGEFEISRVAFQIGNVKVTWYGMIICLGIICAFSYFCYRAGKAGIKFDTLLDYALITVPCAIIGARLYYVLFNLGDYNSFYEVIAVWNGGLAIYGASIVGAITVALICKFKKIKFFVIADALVPGVMLGQLIGRWGNFMNGEAFGSATTLPWRMGICNFITEYETVYVHPTFLYESLWNLVGFILINIFYKKRKYYGEITLWYFGWYGLGRFFIEQLRTDSLYIGSTGIRVSALVGLICVLIAFPAVIVGRVRHKNLAAGGAFAADEISDLVVIFGIKKAEPSKINEEEMAEKAETEQTSESKEKPENPNTGEIRETENFEENKNEDMKKFIIDMLSAEDETDEAEDTESSDDTEEKEEKDNGTDN